jgi:serine/threonine protein kinase
MMIGQRLGSYLIQEKVGSGAMGVVYRALHEVKGITAAVKIITGDTSKGVMSKRFEREATILRSFDDPSIVKFYAWGKSKGTFYLALEFLSGGTLEELLAERDAPLPWKEVLSYSIQICRALNYAHEKQIIHRDLKPSNLMFAGPGKFEGVLKLTDFGIVKDLDENAEALTATGRTLGTAAYMAPEQIRGNPAVGPRTDIYALGCVMFQMLTGEIPFKSGSPVAMMNMHLTAKRPLVSDKGGEIPTTLNLLIRNMMAKDRDERPRDALLVSEELQALAKKVERGEAVEMVFAGGAPARLGGPINPPTSKMEPKSTPGLKAASGGTPAEAATSPTRPSKSRTTTRLQLLPSDPRARSERLKTVGLVSLLLVTIGLIAYVLWPPSAKTLYGKAERLMASESAADWREADREILAELDRRFPKLYVEQKKEWRDHIGLEAARRRAGHLEKPNLGKLSEPKPGAETTFVTVYNEAVGAVKEGRDEEAAQKWRDMAEILLKSRDTEDRSWGRLAQERVQETLDGIEARRKSVEAMLDRADRLVQDGKPDDATRIREDTIRRFGSVRSLRELIHRRTGIDPSAKPESKEPKSDK